MRRKLVVAAIPDLHFPWVDVKALAKVYDIIENHNPQVVIQLGDLYDLYSYSKYARTHDLCTPEEELEDARNSALIFWNTINEIVPRARKIQLRGNHDVRIEKRTLEKAPELYSIVSRHQNDLYKFKGVETILCDKEGIEIEGVLYVHGWLTKLGDHMKSLGKCIVHGHTHRAGIIFENYFGNLLWELDCGYLAGDAKDAIPLRYGPTVHMKWVKGLGMIKPDGPIFIPT